MDIIFINKLKAFGIIPIEYNALVLLLKGYKSPEDKIANLCKKGYLIRLKKGLYLVSSKITEKSYSKELIANHIYGPSYLSFEYTLSYYGLIPERVTLVSSIATKRAKKIATPLGDFEYTKATHSYFAIGLKQLVLDNKLTYLIASPEKAICDMIVFKNNFRIQSYKAIKELLLENYRIDFTTIENWDLSIIDELISLGIKSIELKFIKKLIQDECNL